MLIWLYTIYITISLIEAQSSDTGEIMFATLKDKGLAAIARPALNNILQSRLKGTAAMLDLKVDSKNRRISCTIELAGESSPITVTLIQYELVEEAGGSFLRFDKIETSREWLTVLAGTALSSHRLPIPPRYVGLVKLTL